MLQTKIRPHLSGLGLAAILTIQNLCFYDGSDSWSRNLSATHLLFGCALGTLAGALLLPKIRVARGIAGNLWRGLPGLAASVLLPFALINSSTWAAALACGLVSVPLSFFLERLTLKYEKSLSGTKPGQLNFGLYLGTIFGISYFFWQIPTIVAQTALMPGPSLIAALICLISAYAAVTDTDTDLSVETLDTPAPEFVQKGEGESLRRTMALETLAYMTCAAMAFFLLAAVLDWQFYRIHAHYFHIPPQAYLYLWAFFPLTGSWLDRHFADARLLLFCMAVVIMAPLLIIPLEGTVFYWLVYVLGLAAEGTALLFFILLFAQFRLKFGRSLPHALVLVTPISCMLLANFAARLYLSSYTSIIPYQLLMLVLAASFGYISHHIQYALTLSGWVQLPSRQSRDALGEVGTQQEITAPTESSGAEKTKAVEKETEVKNPASEAEICLKEEKIITIQPEREQQSLAAEEDQYYALCNSMARFSKKYGISRREQDVLALIVEGTSTEEILKKLFISINTFKSHMRQILRKTGCSNRYMLTTLYFHQDVGVEDSAFRQEKKS